MKKKVNWRLLIICLAIVYSVAFLGGIFTSQSVDTEWYNQTRPSITPPAWVFPVVWNFLFFTIALSLYFAWKKSKKKQKKSIALVFGINFILNILWSVFYFGMQNPTLAFVDLIALLFSIASMIYVTRKITRISSCLLIPYFLWVSFAGILNYLSI